MATLSRACDEDRWCGPQLWRLFVRQPNWHRVLAGLMEHPGSTAGDLMRANVVSDASNANGTLSTLRDLGVVVRERDGRAWRWRLPPRVKTWLDAPPTFSGSGEIVAAGRIGIVARDDRPAFAWVLLEHELAAEFEWIATMSDRQIGALFRFSIKQTTTEVAMLRETLRASGVDVQDLPVEDVAAGPSEGIAWARRVLALDCGPRLPPTR